MVSLQLEFLAQIMPFNQLFWIDLIQLSYSSGLSNLAVNNLGYANDNPNNYGSGSGYGYAAGATASGPSVAAAGVK